MAKKQTKKSVLTPAPGRKANQQKPGASKGNFLLNLKLAFVLGLISFLVYANTLKNGYVLDDNSAITKNTIVSKGISAIPEILSTPYRRGYNYASNDLYRPLSLVMFAVEYQFFGLNPVPGHLINIILFAGCVILLFLFLDQLLAHRKTAVAFIASLLFALHPIHTEVVANIKSRDELLCFFFAFFALNVLMRYMKDGKIIQLLIGFFCFLLAFLSKETVITFLAVVPLIFFFYMNENKRRGIYITISIAIAAIICLTARFSVLNYYHANNSSDIDFIDNILAARNLTYDSRFATAFLILGFYLKLLFIPYPLICDYSYHSIPVVNFGDPGALISLVLFIFLAVFGISRFLKNHKDHYAFAILFFLVTISIFSNIPFLIGTVMGERLLFFPSVGFCLVMALLIEKWFGKTGGSTVEIFKNSKVFGIVIPISLVFIFITINRNNDWVDNYTLFTTDVSKVPNNSRLNWLVAVELQSNAKTERDPIKRKQIWEDALKYLNTALAIHPGYSDAHSLLGDVYASLSQYDSAEVHEKMALQLNPKNPDAINNLARVYNVRRNFTKAIELLKRAIELNPNDAGKYGNIGVCYYSAGLYDSAIFYTHKTITIDPNFKESYENMAIIYQTMGKTDSARKYEAIARKNNPGFKL